MRVSNWFQKNLRRPTFTESIAIVGITVVLVALLWHETQWVSDGSERFEIRAQVFDLSTGEPISGAKVAVMKRTYPSAAVNSESLPENIPRGLFDGPDSDCLVTTQKDGTASLWHQFTTCASNRNPESRVFAQNVWIVVRVPGYAQVAVPLRHDSVATAKIRQQGFLFIPVGLMFEST